MDSLIINWPSDKSQVLSNVTTNTNLSVNEPTSAISTGKMYWTDPDPSAKKIQRANLDGSNIEDLVTTGLISPTGIALDVEAGKMYWTDFGTDKIQRANLDGSNVEDMIATVLSNPIGIALDVTGGKMYWTDDGTDKIQRANLDGSNIEDLVTTGLSFTDGIALDVVGGKMYWTDLGILKIQRADLDGTNVQDLITTGLIFPIGIALDVTDGKMYWADRAIDKIKRANIDGTNIEEVVTVGLVQPEQITLDVAGGKMYWTDIGSSKIQRANLDGSNVEDLITSGVISPEGIVLAIESSTPPSPLSVTISSGNDFGAPQDTLRIPATLTSPSAIGGLQFTVRLEDTIHAHFTGLEDTLSNPGFTISETAAGDSTRLVIFSTSGATIPSGTDIPLATLVYVLDPSAVLGSTIGLTTTNALVGDSLGVKVSASLVNGELQVGIRGDVDLDGDVSILDVIKLVRIIIGKDTSPEIGAPAFNISDGNADGNIDIADVIFQINSILGITPKLIASGPTAPVIVSLDAVQTLSNGQTVIPVSFDANGLVAGAQFTFTFDSNILDVGTPYLVGEGLATDSHTIDGVMRVVVYGMTPGAGIKTGQNLYIPVTVRDGVIGSPSVTLSDVMLVNPSAQRVDVTLGETTVVVKDAAVPTSFALDDARPNPFNPSTTISYAVSQQSHVTLIIYNVLGQEVIRLVDKDQTPGNYSVAWHGSNSHGLSVASGVYVYRITSSTGYTDTKRMTLLK